MVRSWMLMLAASSVLVGCTVPEDPLPPGERQIVVHAVLDPSSRVQMVTLGATHGSTAKITDFDSASVVMTTPDGMQLVGKRDTASTSEFGQAFHPLIWRINLDTYGVNLIPGGTYQLRVETRVGDVVAGTTTIPQATPAARVKSTTFFLREVDTLRLSWDAVPGARTYDALIYSTYTFNPGQRYHRLTHQTFTESSLTLAGTAKSLDSDIVFPQNADATAMILAVDVNYYEYYRLLGDPFTGAPPSRLSGGIGVFGSMVPILIREFPVR